MPRKIKSLKTQNMNDRWNFNGYTSMFLDLFEIFRDIHYMIIFTLYILTM